jgi:hypothetical protein
LNLFVANSDERMGKGRHPSLQFEGPAHPAEAGDDNRMATMAKSQNMLRNFTLAGAFAAVVVAGLGSAATSAPNYDGLWSVVIITERGTCDRAYRYPVRISRGSVLNAGDSPVTISGRVGSNGSLTVTVSHGNQRATGSGRLSGGNGVGSWSGGECSGIWQAERRGA